MPSKLFSHKSSTLGVVCRSDCSWLSVSTLCCWILYDCEQAHPHDWCISSCQPTCWGRCSIKCSRHTMVAQLLVAMQQLAVALGSAGWQLTCRRLVWGLSLRRPRRGSQVCHVASGFVCTLLMYLIFSKIFSSVKFFWHFSISCMQAYTTAVQITMVIAYTVVFVFALPARHPLWLRMHSVLQPYT